MPKATPGWSAALVVLVFVLLLSPPVLALTLPNPPDRTAPENNVNGPLPNPGKQAFTGGVLLVKDSTDNQVQPVHEFVANFYCSAGSKTITKQYKTDIGESISGPISNAQTQGIIEAINSVRPPKTVPLTITVNGDPAKNTTYTITGITYQITTYSIWIITQPSPAMEQRVGYIVTSVPQQPPNVSVDSNPCPANHSTPLVEYGNGFKEDPLAWLYQPFIPVFTPPDDGVPPVFGFGIIKVYSGGAIYGVAHVRPGENATFLLPPGSYSVSADVEIFGITFSIPGQSVESPPGATAVILTVSLTTVVEIWYVFEVIVVLIIVAIIWFVISRLRGGGGLGPSSPKAPEAPLNPEPPKDNPPKTEEPEDYQEQDRS